MSDLRRLKAIARQIVALDNIPVREAIEIAAQSIRADERAAQEYVNDYDYMLGPDGRYAE